MPKALCAAIGFCVALSAAADLAQARPTLLSAQDMDAVTAGALQAGALSSAAASGAFNFTRTDTAALVTAAQGSHPSINSQMGAASGTAVAAGIGTGASTATSVSTSGSAGGTFVLGHSVSWSQTVLFLELSGGFTWVSGHTGAFLLGGP